MGMAPFSGGLGMANQLAHSAFCTQPTWLSRYRGETVFGTNPGQHGNRIASLRV
jgi:hypothetical protein